MWPVAVAVPAIKQRKALMSNEKHHSPDVAERTGLDEGFSDGWGAHFLPNERYWIDTHMHVAEHSEWAVRQALGQYFQRTAAFRLDQIIVLDGTPETLDTYAAVAKTDRRFHFMIWPKPDQPDPDFVRRAHKAGSLGMKLHNGPIMRGLQDWKVWESDAWREVFEVCRELRFPILWHVTQRLSTSPYTGGGPGTYWKDGKEKKPSEDGRVGPRSSEAAAGKAEEGDDSKERIVDRRERSQTSPQPTEASVRFGMDS